VIQYFVGIEWSLLKHNIVFLSGLYSVVLNAYNPLSRDNVSNVQHTYSLCGTKCDVQASLLNYLTGFSQISEYSNFTLHNVKIPLQAALKPTVVGGKGTLNPPQKAGDLISPRGEKNYENSILAWRLKQVERYTHSHIKWVTSTSGSAGAVEEEAFEPEDSRGGHRAQVGRRFFAPASFFTCPSNLWVAI